MSTTYPMNWKGGANHSENPDEYDVGALPLQFRAPTRTGYTFDGWYTDANFETLIHEIMTGTTGDVVVYAKWGANTYMVSFDSQEGSVPEPASKSVIYGQEYGPLATTTREGFVFDGWWTEANGTGMQVLTASEVSITTDQTLYGKWRDPEVGTIGQAGGYIFFDKGIYSNGWRYLEAAPAGWSGQTEDPVYLFGFYRIPGDTYNKVAGTNPGIGAGEANTVALVSKMGSAAYSAASGTDTTENYAAKVCADLSITYGNICYDDWFLPSKDELNQMYQNLKVKGLGNFSDIYYWNSKEYDGNWGYIQDFSGGAQYNQSRSTRARVRPVRAF